MNTGIIVLPIFWVVNMKNTARRKVKGNGVTSIYIQISIMGDDKTYFFINLSKNFDIFVHSFMLSSEII